MTELTWAQIIKQAIFDIKNGGIYQARDAYNFIFYAEREEHFREVCRNAGLVPEIVRKETLAIDIPLRVSMLPPKAVPVPTPEAYIRARPAPKPRRRARPPRQLSPNGPKVMGELAYQRMRYRANREQQRKRKLDYYYRRKAARLGANREQVA